MYCKYESIRDNRVLVIDEINRLLGECDLYSFINCVDDSKDCMEDDGYNYFYMDKKKLFSVLNSFSGSEVKQKLNKL